MQKPTPPPAFQEGAIATMDAAGLNRVLTDSASTEFQRAKACQRAGELAAKELVPALAALLDNEHLSVYARHGLEPIADPAAGEALRAALGKLKGARLVGVINSIGKRRDAQAHAALAKLLHNSDADVARAAASALGHLGASKELLAALPKSTGMMKTALADACLLSAERMLEDGKRAEALALYASLSSPDVPKPARLAAMNGIIREETSPTRPR